MEIQGGRVSNEIVKRDEQTVAPEPRGQDIYAAVMSLANRPDTSAEQMRELLAVAREMKADHDRQQYLAAFHAAKADLDGYRIQKRGKIVYSKGGVVQYAKYDDIANVVKPILRKHALTESFSYETLENPPKIVCVMTLTHADGHSETFRSVPLPMVDGSGGKTDIQGAGSVASYGKRFVLVPAFDIITEDEDDDGSGQGVAEPITEEQVFDIEERLTQISKHDPESWERFLKWLEQAHKTRNIRELTQGPQFDGVMELLRKKLAEKK